MNVMTLNQWIWKCVACLVAMVSLSLQAGPPGTAYSIGQPTAKEQFYVELINRARADPTAEGIRLAGYNATDPSIASAYASFAVNLTTMQAEFVTGSASGKPTLTVAEPLSINAALTLAARGHSQDMITWNYQGHDNHDGTTTGARITAQGYAYSTYGENIFASSSSVLYGHAGFEVDWGGNDGTGMQGPPRGHRSNLHSTSFNEIGVGNLTAAETTIPGTNTDAAGPEVTTQDLGRSGSTDFITGVVYYDLNSNGFYDPGEGVGGVEVGVTGSTYKGVTASSGGYSVPVPGNGTYPVTFWYPGAGSASFSTSATVAGSLNKKLDWVPAYTAPSLSGSSTPPLGVGSTYIFPAVGGSTGYNFRVASVVASPAAEGADSGTSGYSALAGTNGYLAVEAGGVSGNTFHFGHNGISTPTLTLPRTFSPRAGGAVSFYSKLRYSTSAQTAKLQVRLSGSGAWTTLWSQAGANSPGESVFSLKTQSLAAYLGQDIELRFLYEYPSGSYYPGGASNTGWFLDAITFTSVDELTNPTITPITGSPATFTPGTTGNYRLAVQPKLSDPLYSLAYGPALSVNVLTTTTIATSASPVAGGNTSGGGTVNVGTSVTVVATPNGGYRFVNWTEGGSQVSTAASYNFTAGANRILVANFALIIPQTIGVEQPTGSALVSGTGSVNFGSVASGANASKSFTIRNSGDLDLVLGSITINGTNPGDFVVNPGPVSPVTGLGTTTFTVIFSPGGGGARSAVLHIPSNDGLHTPFDINLAGFGITPAQITSPTPGTTLGSTNVTLSWNTGAGVTSYALWVGSTLDGYDLYAGSEGTNTSKALILPDDGRTLYVTLFSLINGVNQSNKYTYTAYHAPTPVKARITSPANGSPLASTLLPLIWDAGIGATGYVLYAGTTPGGYDLYAALEPGTSRTITVPADKKIYVTLYSKIGASYLPNYYIFNPLPSAKATLASPSDGSTLGGSSLNLTWNAAVGASKYIIWIGSSPGGYDLGAADAGTSTSRSFTVPQDGGPIYVTLWSVINGTYQSNSYWFTTALPASGNRPARITSPANASALVSASLNLAWDAGVGAASYALWVGSNPDGYDLYAGAEGTNTARTVTIPGDGRRIYVTLHSLISGAYQSNSYYYTAPSLPDKGAAQITSPAIGSVLGGGSLPLTWISAAGASQYILWAGDAPMGYNRYAGAEGLNLNKTITTMPVDGSPVYATLYSLINGAYLPSTAWFTTANTGGGSKRARLTSPGNGSTLSASQSFTWDGGTGVTGCALWIGSSPSSYDLLAAAVSPNNNRTVTLPTDGRKIYVTLHSLIGGAYQSNGWFFTAANTPVVKAAMTSPVDGSVLVGSSINFNWSAAVGATRYYLYVGRKPGGYDVYAGDEFTNLSKTITTMPVDGGPVYVTLWSLINGTYLSNEYIYHSALPP